jgi:hypothetical protein
MGAAFTLQLFYLASAIDGLPVEDPAPFQLPVSYDLAELDFDWDDDDGDSSPGTWAAAAG